MSTEPHFYKILCKLDIHLEKIQSMTKKLEFSIFSDMNLVNFAIFLYFDVVFKSKIYLSVIKLQLLNLIVWQIC